MKRVVFDIVLFLSIFILPWWISAILAVAGIFIFREFYEFLAVGVVTYTLYAIPGSRLITSSVWFPIILVVIFVGTQIVRRYIILYKNEI